MHTFRFSSAPLTASARRGGNKSNAHVFYDKFPELCNHHICTGDMVSCDCPDYHQLWQMYLHSTHTTEPNKASLVQTLLQWQRWADSNPNLTQKQKELCRGPGFSVTKYDRATLSSSATHFTAMRLEGGKKASDSCVMMRNAGRIHVGRVKAFLSHLAPGCVWQSSQDEVNIADVRWLAHVPEGEEAISSTLKCPVFQKKFHDDPTGNMWPLEKLTPCKLLVQPYGNSGDRLVILSRFSSFQQHTLASALSSDI